MIRRMDRRDISAGLRLSAQAGWNQTAADWQRLLAWEPEGCFVAERGGEVVGTVTSTVYGARLAWIGMMLVDNEQRRQGIGRALLSHAVAWLEQSRGVPTCALDATPLGKTLYDGLGFTDRFSLQRYTGTAQVGTAPAGVRPLRADDLSRLAPMDLSVFGADRLRLLRDLVAAHPGHCCLAEQGGAVRGYACGRPGARSGYIGPLVATDPETAEALLRAALAPLAGQPVTVDVPDGNPEGVRLVTHLGLRPQRPFIRMTRGASPPPVDTARYFAIAGPEVG